MQFILKLRSWQENIIFVEFHDCSLQGVIQSLVTAFQYYALKLSSNTAQNEKETQNKTGEKLGKYRKRKGDENEGGENGREGERQKIVMK